MQKPEKSVLLIENDEDLREVFSSFFLEENITVRFAGTCEEACAILDNSPVDVSVLDMESIDPSSHDGFAKLKFANPDVPFVICSIYYDDPDKMHLAGTAPDACIPKPFEREHVISTVKQFMDKAPVIPGLRQGDFERRTSPRRCIRDGVVGIDRKGSTFDFKVRDIGQGGIGVVSERPIPPLSSLNLRIKLPVRGKINSVNAMAKTVWLSRTRRGGSYTAGLRFLQLDPSAEDTLARVMQA